MCLTFGEPAANLDTWISTRRLQDVPSGWSGGRWAGTLKSSQTSANGMTTVEAITAGSGDTYRIEWVYLDRDQACGLVQDCNEIAPVEPVQVEEWRSGARRRPRAARTGGGPSGGRGCRSASVASTCGTPATASGATTSISAGNGGSRTPCWSKGRPSQTRRVPKAEVAGLSNEKVTETLGT